MVQTKVRVRSKTRKHTPKPELTRSEKRLVAKNRRAAFMLIGSIVVSGLILIAWFPANALYSQRVSLASATRGLNQVSQQDSILAHEQRSLMSSTEIGRMARERFQLVEPGQQAYQVLPPNWPSTSGSSTTISNQPYPGDPGLEPPVAPSAAAEVLPGSGSGSASDSGSASPTVPAPGATQIPLSSSSSNASGSDSSGATSRKKTNGQPVGSRGATSTGIVSRILRTLEFWR